MNALLPCLQQVFGGDWVRIKNRFTQLIIKTYYNESIYTAVIDFVAVTIMIVVLFFVANKTEFNKWFGVVIVTFYIILSTILNHTLSLLILYDLKYNVVKTTTATVLAIKTEASWSGHLWHSVIKDFFPKDKDVQRIKMSLELENGKRLYLRTLMSFERRLLFYDTFIKEQNSGNVKLEYLPKSKILLSIDDLVESKNKKRRKVIEKINHSL